MKLLIIRFSSIGDIVLTTPVVRCLKEQHKDFEVHFLTKYQFADVISNNPYIDKIHTYRKKEFSLLVESLALENFDYIIDLHNNIRSLSIILRLCKPFYSVN
ncbi:MAG: glycosyl transferase, partial [Bacteroidota bacterium]|nr:glycosyl transferase [Bacteroidota bacterium]